MPRLKLVLEYDGAKYVGWQVQPNGRSVQAVVEGALARLLGAPTPVLVAGRTDAGVHALGQVIAFDTARELPLKAYVQGLSSLLPEDVAVVFAQVAPDGFDPRRWAQGKRYRYQVSNRPTRSPLRRRTCWELFAPLDVPAMQKAAQLLVGRHDFSAFRASNCGAATAVRELFELSISEGADRLIVFEVRGTAFLKHMVRNLVGTLVEVGRGRQRPEWVGEVLSRKDRTLAGATAPAHGLCLVEVFYGQGPREAAEGDDEA